MLDTVTMRLSEVAVSGKEIVWHINPIIDFVTIAQCQPVVCTCARLGYLAAGCSIIFSVNGTVLLIQVLANS